MPLIFQKISGFFIYSTDNIWYSVNRISTIIMNISQLSKFLVRAKINTYASSGEGGENLLPDGNKEFRFKEKEFRYRDRYFGFNPFVGQEVVFQKDNFQYLNKIKGTVEKFEGEEKIFYKGKLVYGLVYHGGIILEK